jgi:hypothetical protein
MMMEITERVKIQVGITEATGDALSDLDLDDEPISLD